MISTLVLPIPLLSKLRWPKQIIQPGLYKVSRRSFFETHSVEELSTYYWKIVPFGLFGASAQNCPTFMFFTSLSFNQTLGKTAAEKIQTLNIIPIIGAVVGSFVGLLLLLLVLLLIVLRVRRGKSEESPYINSVELVDPHYTSIPQVGVSLNHASTSVREDWEILYSEVIVQEEIGKGAYGIVFAGKVSISISIWPFKWRGQKVAIKKLRTDSETLTENQLQDFQKESAVMKTLR